MVRVTNPSTWKGGARAAFLAGLALSGFLGLGLAHRSGSEGKGTAPGTPAAENKYIGADKCKSCHGKPEIGDQYGHWKTMEHSKAFETLASEEAKKIGAEKGIADPQKADQCVKCHVTAFGVPEAEIKKGFNVAHGVQCETCHGPGEQHMKARFTAAAGGDQAAAAKVPAGEIVSVPDETVCTKCHNAESPTFKEFCFHEFSAKVRHLNPGKERATLDIGKCSCPKCASGCPEEHKKFAELPPAK